jgi:Carboxypeptidase regulatory-like domain
MPRMQWLFAFVVPCVVVLLFASHTLAQINTATLSGIVTDPQGLAVRGAKITVTSSHKGAQREALADENGHYTIVGLVPGQYKVHVDGGSNFAPYENTSVIVTVGAETILNIPLTLGTQSQVVTVTSESSTPIETTRSESAQTVNERQIDNLPINGRSYINFTLLNSQTTRDMAPTIGPAPNSGLDISGARARGNMVSVDGADAVDNSVNGIRSTVSQEAVQEFQMILSNYNAEYGRASGGVVNIVTKSGSNDSTATSSAISVTRPSRRAIHSPAKSTPRAIWFRSNRHTRASKQARRQAAPSRKTRLFISSLTNTRSVKRPDSPALAKTISGLPR